MHKIDTETAGENNTFVDKDPNATPPVDGTDLNSAWFNSVQEELCNVVTGFGGTLDNSEGFKNNSQILDVLQRIGVKSGIWGSDTTNGNDVDTTVFKTSHVIFHKAENFTIGALKTGSVVMVIPYWGGPDAPASITVNYTSSSYPFTIKKGQMLIGVVGNGTASYNGVQIVARYMPIMLNPDGDVNAHDVNVNKLVASTSIVTALLGVTLLQAFNAVITNIQYTKRIDAGLAHFDSSDATSWMLKTEWSLNQVKRVYRDDANVSGTGYEVNVPYDTEGSTRAVSFREGSFVEFMCVGYCNIGGTDFAVLLNNGYRY